MGSMKNEEDLMRILDGFRMQPTGGRRGFCVRVMFVAHDLCFVAHSCL